MKLISRALRDRAVKVADLEYWANRELHPLLADMRKAINLMLGAPRYSVGQVIGDEWQQVSLGVVGADLGDTAGNVFLADGDVRTLPPQTLSVPRAVTLSNVGASLARTWELWKLDTSGNDYTVTAGADVVALPGATQWYLECRFHGGAWEAMRLKPLTFGG